MAKPGLYSNLNAKRKRIAAGTILTAYRKTRMVGKQQADSERQQ